MSHFGVSQRAKHSLLVRLGVSQRAKRALSVRLGAFQRADVAFWRLAEGEKCTFGAIPECACARRPDRQMRILVRPRGRNVHFWHVLALSRVQMSHFGVSQRAKCALLARLGTFQRAGVAFSRLPEGETCTFGATPGCAGARSPYSASRILRKQHFRLVSAHF